MSKEPTMPFVSRVMTCVDQSVYADALTDHAGCRRARGRRAPTSGRTGRNLASAPGQCQARGHGRRGASANDGRTLGRNVERVVRGLARPVLTAGQQAFKAPERILLAFDGSAITRKGVEMVAQSPLLRGLPVHLVIPQAMQWQGADGRLMGTCIHSPWCKLFSRSRPRGWLAAVVQPTLLLR